MKVRKNKDGWRMKVRRTWEDVKKNWKHIL